MAEEIERIWVVNGPPGLRYSRRLEILQAYLPKDGLEAECRIRQTTERGAVRYEYTEKLGLGLVREELSHKIDKSEFARLYALSYACLQKTRLVYQLDGYTFELDEIALGDNTLWLLQVEFATVNDADAFALPDWAQALGAREVTGDTCYSGKQLAIAFTATF